MAGYKVRVLICDDSTLVRRLLAKMLETDTGVIVVGEVGNGDECLKKIPECRPDVVLLDLAMPVRDGLATLREARRLALDTRFLVVSTHAEKSAPATLDALREGAVDFVTKAKGMLQMGSIQAETLRKIRAAYDAGESARRAAAPAEPAGEAIEVVELAAEASVAAELTVIGGSSGCMQVLPLLLGALPAEPAGAVVLVLKLPAFLTRQLAAQFSTVCPAPIAEAVDGARVEPGRVYVAPGGNRNLVLARPGGEIVFRLAETEDPVPDTPSINAAMRSAAEAYGAACRGVLISGSGTDGIEGLRAIRTAGGDTVAQDKGTAVVPQLPLAAVTAGVAQRTLSALDIAGLFR
jgi:two-component system chemotaxis response regulator CheB